MSIEQPKDDSHIAVVGMGYVGLTLGVALAETGLKVTGLEVRSDIVELTNNGIPHFQEKGLQQSLERLVAQGLVSATEDTEDIKTASVFFITVGTPLSDDGKVNLESIKNASHQVAKIMPENALIIYRSTMQIGTARNIVKPIIESYGKKYKLSVCPERTLEGKALEELRSLPQIIGGFDEVKGQILADQLVNSGDDAWAGYNIKTDKITNMKKAGIIDPTKVVRLALENAASVAGTVLLTECTVVNELEEDNNNNQPQMDPSMMGMM